MLVRCIKRYMLISPRSLGRLVWDLFSILFIMYSCLYNAFEYTKDIKICFFYCYRLVVFADFDCNAISFCSLESPSMIPETVILQ